MTTRLRGKTAVAKALSGARKQIHLALRSANSDAGDLVSRGRYDEAHSLVEVAREVATFSAEIEGLMSRWRSIDRGLARPHAKDRERTPTWMFYKPIAAAIASAGGEIPADDIPRRIETDLSPILKPGDSAISSTGTPRWQKELRSVRRAMIAEGYLDGDAKKSWKLTDAGRRIARATTDSSVKSRK